MHVCLCRPLLLRIKHVYDEALKDAAAAACDNVYLLSKLSMVPHRHVSAAAGSACCLIWTAPHFELQALWAPHTSTYEAATYPWPTPGPAVMGQQLYFKLMPVYKPGASTNNLVVEPANSYSSAGMRLGCLLFPCLCGMWAGCRPHAS